MCKEDRNVLFGVDLYSLCNTKTRLITAEVRVPSVVYSELFR